MTLPVIVSAAVGLIAVWAIYTYNFLIHARTKVREGMSGVDVQLKLRHDLVPNLNGVVRAYAEHEQDLLRSAAAHRSRAIAAERPEDVEKTENALAGDLSRLIAAAENYPQLKAAEKFIALADELALIEDEIQAARELYNANVEFYNTSAQSIPMLLIAMWMRPHAFVYLWIDPVDFNAVAPRVGEFVA